MARNGLSSPAVEKLKKIHDYESQVLPALVNGAPVEYTPEWLDYEVEKFDPRDPMWKPRYIFTFNYSLVGRFYQEPAVEYHGWPIDGPQKDDKAHEGLYISKEEWVADTTSDMWAEHQFGNVFDSLHNGCYDFDDDPYELDPHELSEFCS